MRSSYLYAYVGNNPVNRRDPLGLWSTESHHFFIDSYFGNSLPASAIAAIKAGSDFADSAQFQLPGYEYMHAQRSANDTAEQSKAKAYAYFQTHMNAYQLNLENGRERDAYFALGMALHPVMDSTSPVHGWDTTFNALTDWRIHGDGPATLEGLNTAQRPYYEALTMDAMSKQGLCTRTA